MNPKHFNNNKIATHPVLGCVPDIALSTFHAFTQFPHNLPAPRSRLPIPPPAGAGRHWPPSRAPPQERTAEPRGQTASRFGRLRPSVSESPPPRPADTLTFGGRPAGGEAGVRESVFTAGRQAGRQARTARPVRNQREGLGQPPRSDPRLRRGVRVQMRFVGFT